MIATKQKIKYQCSSCGTNHVKESQYCHFCKKYNTISGTVIETKKYIMPRQSEKAKKISLESKGKETDLDKWFDFQIKYELDNGECKCQNCNKPIRHQLLSKDTWIRRGSIAHIIPKRPVGGFPSVSTNINNFFIACLDCHKKYDSSYETAMQMPVFQIAKTKFKLFKSAIKEPLGKLPEELIN